MYRLARSAEQRHNHANLNGSCGDEREANGAYMGEGTHKYGTSFPDFLFLSFIAAFWSEAFTSTSSCSELELQKAFFPPRFLEFVLANRLFLMTSLFVHQFHGYRDRYESYRSLDCAFTISQALRVIHNACTWIIASQVT